MNLTSQWPGSTAARGAAAKLSGAVSATGSISADYSYRGKSYFDPQNTEIIAEDGYGLLNARAAVKLDEPNVEFAVFGKNLTDEVYKSTGFGVMDSFGWALAWYGPPRTFGVQVSIRR